MAAQGVFGLGLQAKHGNAESDLGLAFRAVRSDIISDWRVGPQDCYAGDLRGQGLGRHTASTSSLQHAEGVNGVGALPHPGYVRTSSLADSGDEAAHAAGEFLVVTHASYALACRNGIDGHHCNHLASRIGWF